MISIKHLTYRFADSPTETLKDVSLDFKVGELALVAGPTGSGKSTLLKTINGLAPHFTGGIKTGNITIDGTDITQSRPRDLAHLIGYVNQQSEDSLVAQTVAHEIAFGMEQLGTPRSVMVQRVAAISAQVGITELLDRKLGTLSGGQIQRVSIAAALASGAQLLLLDEPTSELDAEAACQFLQLLKTLTRKSGITVVVSEHRIDRLLAVADSVVILDGQGRAAKFEAQEAATLLAEEGRVGSPLLELARKLRWSPVPVTIEAAREKWLANPAATIARPYRASANGPLLTARNLEVDFGRLPVLKVPKLELRPGVVTGVVGANGAGKSTLFWSLANVQKHSGSIEITSYDINQGPEPSTPEWPALVPQSATDLLLASSVAAELRDADERSAVPKGSAEAILRRLVGELDYSLHPRDLSAGQQLALALAIQLVKKQNVILLDEPTRGLDFEAKKKLAEIIATLRDDGKAIAIASHDLDFIAAVSDECLVLQAGQVVSKGPTPSVLATFGEAGPEVWRVTRSAMTIDEVSA